MKKYLEGKKTFLGLAIALMGVFGLARFVSPEETTTIVNNLFEVVGIALAIYGRIKARPKV